MKKLTVLFLAILFMIAGMTYLISMTGTDKTERQALKQNVLDMKKELLGSTGIEVTKPDRVARSRSGLRTRSVFDTYLGVSNGDEFPDDEDDDLLCPCGTWKVSASLAPQETRTFCLECCANQFVRIDLFSERLGSPTDVALVVTGQSGNDIFADDDGRGFSGTSTDSCLIFPCLEDEEYFVTVTNLTHPASGFTSEQGVFTLVADVLCDVEAESNDPGSPQVLYCPEAVVSDEDEDDDFHDPLPDTPDPDEEEDLQPHSVVGTYGGDQGDVDCFLFCLEEGDILFVSLDSAECDDIADEDQVDPVFTLEDEDGAIVASDDDTEDLDPGLAYRVSTSGEYTLCLFDAWEFNPGVYELVWSIEKEHATDDINCTVDEPPNGDPGDDEDGDGDPRNL